MVFSSAAFLFAFFPIYLAVAAFVRNIKACNVLLVIMSLLFYAWGEPVCILLMLFSIAVNYFIALPAGKYAETDCVGKRVLLSLSVIFNITMLALFKYAGFLVGAVNSLFRLSLPIPQIPLPVGISFFTFQTMSYVIDAYRGKCSVQRHFGRFMLYVSFFPQLIAGPIVKYRDIEKQLTDRKVTPSGMADGIRRFILGLSKKLLVANALGATVDGIFAVGAKDMNIALAWAGGIFYTFQIYFDFSGYSDMAIGLGRMAGFRFPENFNYPYTSLSLRDFWKRWHISLTSWFREYVYFPLGGNRKGEIRTGFNRMAVFLLTGIWHGAMWTFVVWGLFHGVFQLLETYLIHPDKWKKPLARVYTMAVVTVGFVLFRSDSIAQALHMIGQMAGGFRFTDRGLIVLQSLLTFYNAFILVVAAVGATPLLKDSANAAAARLNARTAVSCLRYAASLLLFALCMMSIASSSYNPFIYFRF
jgi:Predicted membrane protein involved in D-alanine export